MWDIGLVSNWWITFLQQAVIKGLEGGKCIQLRTVIARCGSLGLYCLGSQWSEKHQESSIVADRFYSKSVHFICTMYIDIMGSSKVCALVKTKCDGQFICVAGKADPSKVSVHCLLLSCSEPSLNHKLSGQIFAWACKIFLNFKLFILFIWLKF